MPDIPSIEHDPARLLSLARRARDARALSHAARDQHDALREKLTDVRRRRQLAADKATWGDPRSRTGAQEQVERLDAEIAEIQRQMGAANGEQDHLTAVAASAGRTYTRALAFAVEIGLTVPQELVGDVAAITRHPAFPPGMPTVRGADYA